MRSAVFAAAILAALGATLILRADTGIGTVAIQPYDQASHGRCSEVQRAVARKFGIQAVVLPVRPLPKSAYYAPRSRYRADRLLDDLGSVKGYDRVVGITAKDISTTTRGVSDFGVLGLGQMPGRACVVSTYRLRSRNNPSLERVRLERVVIHEIGHTLGLPHCPSPKCLMQDAKKSIRTVDASADFCKSCRDRLD